MADIRNVEAACCNVRGNKKADRAIAEAIERAHPVRLVEIPVDRFGVELVLLQGLGNDIDINLAVAEDDRVGAAVPFLLDQGPQERALFAGKAIPSRGLMKDGCLGDCV